MYPSPFRDDGYDISDYTNIHPSYGTLDDFRRFLDEAHARGLARRHRARPESHVGPACLVRRGAQLARQSAPRLVRLERYRRPLSRRPHHLLDTELSNWAWDPVSKAYYWHRFFSHQPDLNYDNPAVREAIWKVMKFWLDLGVDGFRVDAVPYLIEREGTSCENLPETHAVLRDFAPARRAIHGKVLLAEANMWPEDVRPYFGDGDEFHMAFHFPIMPRMFMALRLEDRKPLIDIIERTPPIPDSCQWGIFLRNHDELTLEMVTDIERGVHVGRIRPGPAGADQPRHPAAARAAARGRPAAHRTDERSAHVAARQSHRLLRRRDRHGRQCLPRRPQQRAHADAVESGAWNAGFSPPTPSGSGCPLISNAVYGYQAVNVESQKRSPTSLLNWMRRIIEVRRVDARLRPRLDRVPEAGQSPGAGVHAHA